MPSAFKTIQESIYFPLSTWMAAVIGALGERVPTNIYLWSSSGCSVLSAAHVHSKIYSLPRILTVHNTSLTFIFGITRA